QPLVSRQTAWWRVRAWDKNGVASPWSAAASWEDGLLAQSDWQASWITSPSPPLITSGLNWIWYPDPGGDPATSAPAETVYFRRTFTLDTDAGAVGQATVSVTADESYELYVNGIHAASGTC